MSKSILHFLLLKNIYYKLAGCLILILFSSSIGLAQDTISLYPNAIPNSKPVSNEEYSNESHSAVFKVSRPALSIYLPQKEKANGTAVIICPGGGYHALMMQKEGYSIAMRLVKKGIAAFVLKYRLPNERTMKNTAIGPLQDAQQAIKTVRINASKWHIDPDKVGIMGFSAGGHVASTAGTHFNQAYIDNKEKTNLRPDFMVLVYPVISMTDRFAHLGSRKNLLGAHPSDSLIQKFSNEKQVTATTPPAFIVQAEDDSTVQVENSIRFYRAMHQHRLPVALHIYQKGGHGFGKYPPRDLWMQELFYWMHTNGWM